MKKGFSSIELIIVIVIALITAFVLYNSLKPEIKEEKVEVENITDNTIEIEVRNYIDAIEYKIMMSQVDTDFNNDIKDGTYDVLDLDIQGFNYSEGFVKIEKSKVVSLEVKIEKEDKNYLATYNNNEINVAIDNK